MRFILIVAFAWAITFTLRSLPFVIRSRVKNSRLLHRLSILMPIGIMIALTIYSMQGLERFGKIPLIAGIVTVVILHVWRSHTLLSILGGLGVYALALALTGAM
ncbi:AzlD domain-containing protein [Actinotignum urinale]|uniref:AzlD domain-containing protein n=1 Tax=Actinotignum urinale TaxID=190146 RepID=UPI002A7FA41B|nr:AzlD domain-containing protein [Actinotignum urinale]MDY5151974.1 AzlD domain-containing protein [Actinotignum urinale]